MNNILLDELPTEYEGYQVNTSFRIGIQIALVRDDEELADFEKSQIVKELLFCDDDGEMRECPNDINSCVNWFMNGWYHDKSSADNDNKKRIMDFDIDQFRIYADFLQIYGIDLNIVDLHWWAFEGLLWNMPHEKSSFLQTIEIRTKKPHKGASAEEIRAIEQGHKQFDLKQHKQEKTLTREDERKIDAFDEFLSNEV